MNSTLVNLQTVGADCDYPGTISSGALTGTMVHPSGATGSFTLSPVRHGRSNVFRQCAGSTDAGWSYPSYPRNFDTFSLTRKSIAGPGLEDLTWTYDYGPDNASWEADCTSGCPGTVTTIVTDPKGDTTRYTYGNRFRSTEGQLQSVDIDGIRVTRNRYRSPDTGEFVNPAGTSDQTWGDSQIANALQPLDQRVITQQGVDFTWEVPAGKFDKMARAAQVVRSNSQGNSRTETTMYDDRLAKWVLGQVSTVTESSTGKLITVSHFGHLDFTMTYNADGTLATRKDGNGYTTVYSNYRGGLPQTINYPDNTSERAEVSDIGTVTAFTDAANFTTRYHYDDMGRLDRIIYPTADSIAWNDTQIRFEQIATSEFNLPAGHWRQQITTDQGYIVNYFDALWRLVYTAKWDSADVAATMRIVKHAYDFAGRKNFDSYPKRSYGEIGDGLAYEYDALGRQTASVANSELGNIVTNNWYNSGFQKATVDGRGIVTNYSYQAFDNPTEDAITNIAAAEGVNVAMARDMFGKPTSITRSGAGKSATRSYVYDNYCRLCKTIEPETGATVQDYDAANNVSWRASGLALPSTASCDTASVPRSKMIGYSYDPRNRMTRTGCGDGSPAITRTYTPDGLPNTITSNGAAWTNTYNKRRLNERESLAYGGVTYNIDRTYDANASLLQMRYPDNSTVDYNPNALGEPRQVGPYANAITYHPNGALASFRYGSSGNGIAHSTMQNVRGLPWISVDSGVINDEYTYDANANVTGIVDRLQPSEGSRSMVYDNLDRLKTVSAPNLWGSAAYIYDTLDNLTAASITAGSTARSTIHTINPATNRLDSISNGPPGYNFTYSYDSQGNIIRRGAQTYVFDQGNRMTSAPGKATYGYDGLNHRMTVVGTDGVNRVQVYSQGGQLLYIAPSGGTATKYIYLHNHVLAEVNGATITYDHTNALGSPVAQSNAAGTVLTRTLYEPYGYVAVGSPRTIGFTGHVNDKDTGLVYMQQRYYDSFAGRMLSIDPVITDANTGGSFNRYAYANNSPYKYVDPDGRNAVEDFLPKGAPIVAFGKTIAAAIVIIEGMATGNASMIKTGYEGLQENKAANIEGLAAILSKGRDGKGGPGRISDPVVGQVGRISVSIKGNAMLEPLGGATVPAGKGGTDTHTLYPNGSNAQRLNEQGHPNNPTPHGHGHQLGTGPGMKGQGPSTDPQGNVVKPDSPEAHWPIN